MAKQELNKLAMADMQSRSPMAKMQRASREEKDAREAFEYLQSTATALKMQFETLQEKMSANTDKLTTAKDTLEQNILAHQATTNMYQEDIFAGAEPEVAAPPPQHDPALLAEFGFNPEDTAKWAGYNATLKELANTPAQTGGQQPQQPPVDWPLEEAWGAPAESDVKMPPASTETQQPQTARDAQWEQHDECNTVSVSALHKQIADLQIGSKRNEALEAFASRHASDTEWGKFQEIWKTKCGKGNSNKGKGASSSPYGGSAQESEDHMG